MITFSTLKKINDTLSLGDESYFVDFLNTFPGDNIYQKYKNILISWENDVSYYLNLSLDEKSVKVTMSYAIKSLEDDLGGVLTIKNDSISVKVDVPKKFTTAYDTVPIYEVIHSIFYGMDINLDNLSYNDRKSLIDNLPADLYTKILKEISKTDKVVIYDNTNLTDVRLNFLTNDTYLFLRGLFTPYGKDYYRDIIFYLSKRIGSEILMNSTMMDVEYYIEKMNDEQKENPVPTLF